MSDESKDDLQLLREATEIVDDLLMYIKISKGQLPQHDNGIGAAFEYLAKMYRRGQPITMTWAVLLREKGLLEPLEEGTEVAISDPLIVSSDNHDEFVGFMQQSLMILDDMITGELREELYDWLEAQDERDT